MLDGNWREVVDRGLVPIGRSLRRTGISADVVTLVGIVMATAAAVAIGLGYLRLGFLLLVLTGIPDALDGAVAKASGTSSSRGAYFDSVADRLTDALLFGGVAWHLATVRTDHMMMLPVAIMATAMFISLGMTPRAGSWSAPNGSSSWPSGSCSPRSSLRSSG